MKSAIMQPYFLPYIGYYQLINAVDKFVFYDDVSFIKQGWINRNKIKVNGKEYMFTVPLKNASSNNTICKTELDLNQLERWKTKFLKTIDQAYNKAPYFSIIRPMVEESISTFSSIAEMSEVSNKKIADYIGVETEFYTSSRDFNHLNFNCGKDRVISIVKALGSKTYINAKGGQTLYERQEFFDQGIELKFLSSNSDIIGKDKTDEQSLSILHYLMNYNPRELKKLLNKCVVK
jgi:hypothetical protein